MSRPTLICFDGSKESVEALEQAAAMLIDAEALHGKPAPTILRVADEQDVGVIVLGAGRHMGLGNLGSVSARVAHDARRPVLLIRS